MSSNPALRILVAGVSAAAVMVGLSFVINEAWLAAEHARHAFFRGDDDPLRMPGLAVSSLAWGVLLAWGYRRFAGALQVRRGAARGAVCAPHQRSEPVRRSPYDR